MKGKKFYIAIIGLFVIGIGSIVMYRQQQEARALEFEGYEIATIESRVDGLYNKEKTDIEQNIEPELAELEQIFSELSEKDLSSRSQRHIEEMEEKYLTAKEMHELQEKIVELFNEKEIVQKNISLEDIEKLETSLVTFEDKTVYYKRNNQYISEARVQLETIEEATDLVEKLMTDEELNEDVDEEQLEELEELINQIKDEDIKEGLLEKIEAVRLVFGEQEVEEELALEEEEELVEEDMVEEEESVETVEETNQTEEQTSPSTTQNNSQTATTQAPASNNKQTSSPTQSTKQPSKPTNKPANNPSTKQPTNQSGNTSSQQPAPVEQRPAVAEKYQETKVIEEIPYQTHEYENSNIAAGEEIVYVEGSNGAVTETYEVTVYSNGTSNKKVISKDRTEPVDRVVTKGTKEN